MNKNIISASEKALQSGPGAYFEFKFSSCSDNK